MSWSLEYDSGNGILIETFSGPCTTDDLLSGSQERIKLGKEHKCKHLLIDVRECLVSLGITMPMYNLVNQDYQKETDRHAWKIAVTTSSDSHTREIIDFYMNLTKNRGWKTKKFDNIPDAIDWLNE